MPQALIALSLVLLVQPGLLEPQVLQVLRDQREPLVLIVPLQGQPVLPVPPALLELLDQLELQDQLEQTAQQDLRDQLDRQAQPGQLELPGLQEPTVSTALLDQLELQVRLVQLDQQALQEQTAQLQDQLALLAPLVQQVRRELSPGNCTTPSHATNA